MREPADPNIIAPQNNAARDKRELQGAPDEWPDAQDEWRNIRETPVEVISAVRLTAQQRQSLEIRLIRMLKKRLSLRFTVDPDLLGGIRIVADNIVIDDSIKRKLQDMKSHMVKGVFQAE